jgi:signal transduction histidine kinase
MSGERLSTQTDSQNVTIQRTLRQIAEETGADAAFLVMPSATRMGATSLIGAWYPPSEQSVRLMARWIRRAVNHAIETGRTTLAAGGWRMTLARSKRLRQLIVASVGHGDSSNRSALAILLPSAGADSATITLLERAAQEMPDILARHGAFSPQPPPHPAQPAEPSKQSLRILFHQLRVPLSAASYSLEALVMRHAAHYDRWDSEDEHLTRIAQLGLNEAQGILRAASQSHYSERHAEPPNLDAVSLEAVIARARDLFPAARSRMRLDLQDNLPLARADELWLTQALTNLLDNAVKYSAPHTLIKVAAQQHGADRVQIAVSSVGADDAAEQRLIPAREAMDAPFPGQIRTGLGLSVTRRLVTSMGGDIHIESDGHGTVEVTLTLPAAFT